MNGESTMQTSENQARTSKILIVDDDHRNVRLMESILTSSGYDVCRAYDGEEALEIVQQENPDLILLDVMMPRMSGLELCQRLRSRHATRLLPIIMVTALNASDDKVRALETGADDFLSKPINKMVMLAKVRSILRVKFLQDEVERQRQALERANQELVRMQRFKESMTQMVVHDMKNPLAGIMGNIQLIQIQQDELKPKKRAELLDRTLESSAQLMRMILNILHIGRLEENRMPLRPEPLELREVADENLREMMSVSVRESITMENRIAPDLPQPRADRELISRIVSNLLSNALKHTRGGGHITIDAHSESEGIVFSVRDTGEGIPEDLQPFIFERFTSGEPQKDRSASYDSGLGLTFCRLAIQAHGGRIWLQSRLKEGTTVYVALPLEPAAAEPSHSDDGDPLRGRTAA
jgi:signal transduction histidine kinase